ncbi:hypothetical protein ACIQ7S_03590 [Streptomyces griseoluteus]|uniref:hypothetical protein n=1 Tax=Streptomyces griseoluteus TaxID=29306 RepID=UPI003332A25E
MSGERFWRVRPGPALFRDDYVRVQLRERGLLGSVVVDEFMTRTANHATPADALKYAQKVITERQARDEAVRALYGDHPLKGA